ncbi:MAG: hypothetical protein HQL69_15730 [Magnetococcales bacterium]|nr:hypothetical protein [Magnetococcales bacterium]
MDSKNSQNSPKQSDNNETDGNILEFINSKNGLKIVAAVLLVILLIVSFGNSDKEDKNSSKILANIAPPVVHGLYIGMSIDEANKIIKQSFKRHLFLSDEFMYSHFESGSDAYKDAAILRNNIKFIKQKNGSFVFGGPFSFGYKTSNLRSGYSSVYTIIAKDTKLNSKQQSFGTGMTIEADSNQVVNSILIRPVLLKSIFELKNIDNEDFIEKFVSQHNLNILKREVNGALLGDSSVSYIHEGNNGFMVTIDDDLTIKMQRITTAESRFKP